MIEFRDVLLRYNDHVVLDGVSFSAAFHEKIAVLGPSGEGKTTILKVLLGLAVPDSGAVLVNGRDVAALPESELRDLRRNFTIVFQEGALFDSLTVRENVAFCLRERGDMPEPEIENTVRALLRRVGIENAIHLMPDELSGGMQRRAAIARSLAACEPKMMLYDEPTTGLDPITADTIVDVINELSAGAPPDRTGLIMVTHNVADAARIAERFLYLRDGRIAFDGDLAALKATGDPVFRRFIRHILD